MNKIVQFPIKESEELEPLENLVYKCECGSTTWNLCADRVAECTECRSYIDLKEMFEF